MQPIRHRRLGAIPAVLAAAALVLVGCSSSATVTTTAADQSSGAPATPAEPDAKLLADSGFRVATNGFSFENYGNENAPANLDSASMRALYGDQVCARTSGDTCTLTSVAKAYMSVLNDSMSSGHCYGMAAAASLLRDGGIDIASYGASTASQLPNSPQVQALIARYFATQNEALTRQSQVPVTDAVATLTKGMTAGQDFILTIFDADGQEGHAITPTSLFQRPDGTVEIHVYDNNFPDQDRILLADPAANTWHYEGSPNPSTDPRPYDGSPANQLGVIPVSAVTGVQDCPICQQTKDSRMLVMIKDKSHNVPVRADIVRPDGEPPVDFHKVGDLSNSDSTTLSVGTTGSFVVTLTGGEGATAADDVDVAVIGPGWVRQVNDITVTPGQKSALVVDQAAHRFTWTSDGDSAPTFSTSGESGDASYGFQVTLASLPPGTPATVGSDPAAGTASLTVGTGGNDPYPVKLVLDRSDANNDGRFDMDFPDLTSGQTFTVNYAQWNGGPEGPISATLATPGQPDVPVTLTTG